MNSDLDSSALDALMRILELWPKPNEPEHAVVSGELGRYLSRDFDEIDLLNRVTHVRETRNVRIASRKAEIDFVDIDGCLHRAVLYHDDAGSWKLRSLKFQCPICFGSGKNDADDCPMCGGQGWGAS